MKVCILLATILAAVPTLLIGRWLLGDGTEGTLDWRIWRNTPAWDLALAVKRQDTVQIADIAKAHPEVVNYQEPHKGATLLMWAVGTEKYQSAEALLNCGANPNLKSTLCGETALFVAASYSWVDSQAKEDPKYVKLLLKYGADPNINYVGGVAGDNISPGTSPLMRSIRCGIEKTKALVEGGADINHKIERGKTAAILALWAGGPNATEDGMEYAYYLIAEKKAKVTEPYYVFAADGVTTEPVAPVNDLRDWIPELDSRGYRMKMKIVEEFARQGVDYWKTEIPAERLQQIQKIYPDTWQEYIKKY